MSEARTRYNKLSSDRQPYLVRARDAAKYTIPALFPPEGYNGSTRLPTPYQSIGSRGVNNLSSKLMLALFPPNSPFYRCMASNKLQMEDDVKTEVENAFSQIEQEIQDETEKLALRPSLAEAKKQLLVAGNVLLYLNEDGLKTYRLDKYVVKRDGMGSPIEIVIKEALTPSTIDRGILESCEVAPSVIEKNDNIDLYTYVKLVQNQWVVSQDINDHLVPGSEGTYPKDASPWMPLRWTRIDGEDYGRGYVEEYLGDLISCEELSKAIVQGSAAAAKILFMVNPNGITKVRSITNAENLDVILGNAEEVTVLQLDKFADFRIALETLDRIEGRLSFAFMLNSAVQRNGERVTAEEIRYMAGELEDALGGIYSLLAQEEQMPLIKALMAQMRRQGSLPSMPKGVMKLSIITGLEALGRNHDLEKLKIFLEYLQPVGQDAIPTYINVDNYITRIATALSMSTKDLIKSQDEIQQNGDNSQIMEMMKQFGPEVLKQMAAAKAQQGQPQ